MITADSAFAQTEANFKNQMDHELGKIESLITKAIAERKYTATAYNVPRDMLKSIQVELESKGFRASIKKALHQMDTDTIEIHWGSDHVCS